MLGDNVLSYDGIYISGQCLSTSYIFQEWNNCQVTRAISCNWLIHNLSNIHLYDIQLLKHWLEFLEHKICDQKETRNVCFIHFNASMEERNIFLQCLAKRIDVRNVWHSNRIQVGSYRISWLTRYPQPINIGSYDVWRQQRLW